MISVNSLSSLLQRVRTGYGEVKYITLPKKRRVNMLTEELKKEHAWLVETLNKVKEIGVTSKEGKEKLLLAKTGLIGHLKKEDEKLYPALRKEAQGNEQLKRLLDSFAKDMENISKATMIFFDKYSSGSEGSEFAKDFGNLVASLGGRIRKEEVVLYPEYEKL